MNHKLNEYVDGVFAAYEGTRSVSELKQDLLTHLRERFRDLKADGKDDAAAFEMTVDSIGDIEQTVQEVSNFSRLLERQMATRFDSSDLRGSDFACTTVRDGRFETSDLRGADFARAEINGASFKSSSVADANFDGAKLADVTMTTAELSRSSFHGTILFRTDFSMSGLGDVRFTDAALTDVAFRKTDLRRTVFEGCTFTGVDFTLSDLRGLNLDGSTLRSVKFERAAVEGVRHGRRGAARRVLPRHQPEVSQRHPHRRLRRRSHGQADLRRAQGPRGRAVRRDRRLEEALPHETAEPGDPRRRIAQVLREAGRPEGRGLLPSPPAASSPCWAPTAPARPRREDPQHPAQAGWRHGHRRRVTTSCPRPPGYANRSA